MVFLICSKDNEKYLGFIDYLSQKSEEFNAIAGTVLSLLKEEVHDNKAKETINKDTKSNKQRQVTVETSQTESDIMYMTGEMLEIRQKEIDKIEQLMGIVHEVTLQIAGEVKKHDETLIATARHIRKTRNNTAKAAKELQITSDSRRSSAQSL